MNKQERIQAIERIINRICLPIEEEAEECATAIEEAIGDREGLIIKKYIMTLPMHIRRAIMKHDSEAISTNKEVITIKELK